MTAILGELCRQHTWANLGLVDVCAKLDPTLLTASTPGTFGSIHATLAHIAVGDERFLSRLTDQPPPDLPAASDLLPSLAEVRDRLLRSGEQLVAVAARVEGDPPVRLTGGDQAVIIPASVLFGLALNHATEHRAQVCTILTQLGVNPPDLSAWHYFHERTQAAGF